MSSSGQGSQKFKNQKKSQIRFKKKARRLARPVCQHYTILSHINKNGSHLKAFLETFRLNHFFVAISIL
jgi:hypothetical protein